MSRISGHMGRRGFTLIELLVAVGIVVVLGAVTIAVLVSRTDTQHKALKAQVVALCADQTKTSPGKVVLRQGEAPGRIEQRLGADLDPIRERRVEWRRTTAGDRAGCEMRYVYEGRRAGSTTRDSNDTPWEPAS